MFAFWMNFGLAKVHFIPAAEPTKSILSTGPRTAEVINLIDGLGQCG
jgi:hypothetical protein